MSSELSKEVFTQADREMLDKATEIFELFQRAIKIGYSISFTPQQLKELITVCESGVLYKPEKRDEHAH